MRFVDFLRLTVLLSAAAASLLAVLCVAGASNRDETVLVLGIAGWWVKNRRAAASIDSGSLRAYEAMLRVWRPIEERLKPPVGLSLIAKAQRSV